jgi:hypothetical protein
MRCSPAMVAWIDRAESFGVRPELIGDLHEEVGLGRSGWWLCGQLLALAGVTAVAWVRDRLQTPRGVRCLVVGLALLAIAMVPAGQLLQAWLVVYYLAGMLSLFAHMVAAETQLLPDSVDE